MLCHADAPLSWYCTAPRCGAGHAMPCYVIRHHAMKLCCAIPLCYVVVAPCAPICYVYAMLWICYYARLLSCAQVAPCQAVPCCLMLCLTTLRCQARPVLFQLSPGQPGQAVPGYGCEATHTGTISRSRYTMLLQLRYAAAMLSLLPCYGCLACYAMLCYDLYHNLWYYLCYTDL
jgi:hypothetical protein